MINVKIDAMIKENIEKIFIAGAIIAIAAVYFIFYQPLLSKIKNASSQLKAVELNIVTAREGADLSRKGSVKKILSSENSTSSAIEELTAEGKTLGVRFISMTPQAAQDEKDCKVMPVVMDIESSYENLGVFLGFMEKLKYSLCIVESFDITPDQKNASRMQAHITVKMYLSKA